MFLLNMLAMKGWIKITTECLLVVCDKILVGYAIHNFAYVYQEVNDTALANININVIGQVSCSVSEVFNYSQ